MQPVTVPNVHAQQAHVHLWLAHNVKLLLLGKRFASPGTSKISLALLFFVFSVILGTVVRHEFKDAQIKQPTLGATNLLCTLNIRHARNV